MPKAIRIILGSVAVIVLAYWSREWSSAWLPGWLPEWGTPLALILALTLVGVVAGVIMGSWVSVVLTPVIFAATRELVWRLECSDCLPGDDFGLWFTLLQIVVLYGPMALGAAAGTALARSLAPGRWRRSETRQQRGEA